jgi:hypothetical protein
MGNCPPLLPSGRRRSKNARVVQSGFPGYSGGCGGNVIGYWVDPRTVVCSEIVRFPGLPSRLSSQTRRTSRHNGRLIRHRMSALLTFNSLLLLFCQCCFLGQLLCGRGDSLREFEIDDVLLAEERVDFLGCAIKDTNVK